MTRPLNRDRSLEELEDDGWPAPSGDATRLVATAHALRREPIGELTVEDMTRVICWAVLTRSPETWSKSPELGRELRLGVSDLSDLTPDLKREVERSLAL